MPLEYLKFGRLVAVIVRAKHSGSVVLPRSCNGRQALCFSAPNDKDSGEKHWSNLGFGLWGAVDLTCSRNEEILVCIDSKGERWI